MSSILEALRELERSRPPRPTPRPGAVVEAPTPRDDRSGTFITVAGGLAVGVVVFGLVAWGVPNLLARHGGEQSVPASDAAPVEAPAPDRPAWLDTADPPRARIDASPVPDRPERPARAAAHRTPEEVADEPPPRAERPNAPAGQLTVESVAYSSRANERVATLRMNGRRVTLRQRESADGVEVQLIMPDGVYVQRGSEVFLLPVGR